MIKYHFYKCGREPEEAHRYFDHSTGVCGFLAPQDRRNYLGYMTIEELDRETPYTDPSGVKTAVNGRGRYANVTKGYNSRY